MPRSPRPRTASPIISRGRAPRSVSSSDRNEMTIAVLPGDGSGVEGTARALRVLRVVRADLDYAHPDVGGAAIDRHGSALPAETLALCRRSAGLLFVPVIDPPYDAPGGPRPESA